MYELNKIKGITPLRLKKLNNLGIKSVYDLISYKPIRHVDMSHIKLLNEIENDELALCKVKIISKPVTRYIKKNMNITEFTVCDGFSNVKCYYFNQPYMSKKDVSKEYVLIGKFQNGQRRFINPSLEPFEKFEKGIIPFYSVKKELNQKVMRMLIKNALLFSKENNLFKEIPYINLVEELYKLHFPKTFNELSQAMNALKLFEAECLWCAIDLISPNKKEVIPFENFKRKEFISTLPFELTKGQMKAFKDIEEDLKRNIPMNRLLQGDVGCGKTVVAVYALYLAVINGYQGALICPTEVLAKQNFMVTKNILSAFGLKVGILTGATTKKEREQIEKEVKSGGIDVLVGTHALFDVEFNRLNMLITDEQHRFGVKQRAKLINGNVLIMSATPIPRTLALIAFNKLSLTVIDELPKGRLPVETYVIYDNKRNDMYNFIYDKCINGDQAYVVCPLIEDSESINATSVTKLYKYLCKTYGDINIALLHGKLKQQEKDEIINSFKAGKVNILVSTTVIEVGVDVPNASIMVIENSDRFGLAALHQLRGRVGRGQKQSFCFACLNGCEINERINIFKNSYDGLSLAKMDLNLRGAGELIGFNQHGKWVLDYIDFSKDSKIIFDAIEKVNKLESTEKYNDFKRFVYLKYQDILSEIALN